MSPELNVIISNFKFDDPREAEAEAEVEVEREEEE